MTRARARKVMVDKVMVQTLGIQHPEAQGRDGLDFHDLHVDTLRRALEVAFEAGVRVAKFRAVR